MTDRGSTVRAGTDAPGPVPMDFRGGLHRRPGSVPDHPRAHARDEPLARAAAVANKVEPPGAQDALRGTTVLKHVDANGGHRSGSEGIAAGRQANGDIGHTAHNVPTEPRRHCDWLSRQDEPADPRHAQLKDLASSHPIPTWPSARRPTCTRSSPLPRDRFPESRDPVAPGTADKPTTSQRPPTTSSTMRIPSPNAPKFTAHPEDTGAAAAVDLMPPKKVKTRFGVRGVFKVWWKTRPGERFYPLGRRGVVRIGVVPPAPAGGTTSIEFMEPRAFGRFWLRAGLGSGPARFPCCWVGGSRRLRRWWRPPTANRL